MNFNEMISTEASPFQYTEFGLLESVEVQGELFFPASASAKILGYHNPRKAIIDHCDAPVKLTVPHPQNKEKTIVMNYIREADLYSLIFDSRLPAAKTFKRWVTKEVLPCIRKYGCYCTQEFLDECDHNPYTIQRRLRELKQSRVVEFLTENPEACKRLCAEKVIDVEFSEAS